MISEQRIYVGTDSGATTTKIAAVRENGEAVSTRLLQRPTNAQNGRDTVIAGWIAAIGEFLAQNNLSWPEVRGVGLAIPGPYLRYGVLGKSPNLPADFNGWDVHADFSAALAKAAGRGLPLAFENDGRCGGVAEARIARAGRKLSVLMLMPGSGLGSAFVDENGLPLTGHTFTATETAHMAAPLHLFGLDAPPFPCGCGKNWGCIEPYTTISGLPHLLREKLKTFPDHELARATAPMKEKVLSLRSRAQKGDALALEIFDLQAHALGFHVANLMMLLDPGIVIIGGGLMDQDATTPEFRERYLHIVRETAMPYLWPVQRNTLKIIPAVLGELSQAIGAALVALYLSRGS